MKSWRVYANNCTIANPIEEIGAFTVAEAIQNLVNHAMEGGNIAIDEADDEAYFRAMEDATDTATDYFYNGGRLEIGDYYIERAEEAPTERPNCCHWSTEIF